MLIFLMNLIHGGMNMRYKMPLMIGTHVFHHIFGRGIVFGVSDDVIEVDFLGDLRKIHRDFLLILPGQK